MFSRIAKLLKLCELALFALAINKKAAFNLSGFFNALYVIVKSVEQ